MDTIKIVEAITLPAKLAMIALKMLAWKAGDLMEMKIGLFLPNIRVWLTFDASREIACNAVPDTATFSLARKVKKKKISMLPLVGD